MTIRFAGTSISDLRFNSGIAGSSNATYISTAVCVEGLALAATSDYGLLPEWTATESGFINFRWDSNGGTVRAASLFELHDAAGNAVLRLFGAGSNVIVLQYYNGAAWTTVGAGYTYVLGGGIYTFTIEWSHTASGVLGFYVNGVEIARSLSNYSALADIVSGRINRICTNNTCYYSEIIVDTQNTMNKRLYTIATNSNGVHTDFTGGFGNIDEVGITTTDVISAASNGLVSTFKGPARTIPGTYGIDAVIVTYYGRKSASGPGTVIPVVRSNGVDYEGASDALSYGYAAAQQRWLTDPNTGVAWTVTRANDAALEFGYKSAA